MDELRSQMSAESLHSSKSSKEITNEPITGAAGIRVTGNEDIGYCATLGRVILSPNYKTQEEVEEAVNRKDYDILMSMTLALVDIHEQNKELTKKGEVIVKNQQEEEDFENNRISKS